MSLSCEKERVQRQVVSIFRVAGKVPDLVVTSWFFRHALFLQLGRTLQPEMQHLKVSAGGVFITSDARHHFGSSAKQALAQGCTKH